MILKYIRKFEWTKKDKENPVYPATWKHEPNHWFCTDDYRTVVIYDILYLRGYYKFTEDENFVQAITNALIESCKVTNHAEALDKKCAVKTTE